MSDEELLTKFREYVAKVGRATAISRLTAREVCTSTADQLVRGDYKGKPRRKLRSVLSELVSKRAS